VILFLASSEHKLQIAEVCTSVKFVDRVRSVMLL
jgi:hypothetical protein